MQGSSVWQADALEHALVAALPLGPQSPAGGVLLPDSFHGELQVPSCHRILHAPIIRPLVSSLMQLPASLCLCL
jgi:hypothetical protein